MSSIRVMKWFRWPAVLGVLIASLVGTSLPAAELYTLAASDPPEVVRLNHQSNLKALDQEHQALLKQLAHASTQEIKLENQRYSLEVERENAAFDAAFKGANERLKQEEASRQAQLAEQAQRIRAEREKMESARRDERRDHIRKSADAGNVSRMVQAGDAAVQRP